MFYVVTEMRLNARRTYYCIRTRVLRRHLPASAPSGWIRVSSYCTRRERRATHVLSALRERVADTIRERLFVETGVFAVSRADASGAMRAGRVGSGHVRIGQLIMAFADAPLRHVYCASWSTRGGCAFPWWYEDAHNVQMLRTTIVVTLRRDAVADDLLSAIFRVCCGLSIRCSSGWLC